MTTWDDSASPLAGHFTAGTARQDTSGAQVVAFLAPLPDRPEPLDGPRAEVPCSVSLRGSSGTTTIVRGRSLHFGERITHKIKATRSPWIVTAVVVLVGSCTAVIAPLAAGDAAARSGAFEAATPGDPPERTSAPTVPSGGMLYAGESSAIRGDGRIAAIMTVGRDDPKGTRITTISMETGETLTTFPIQTSPARKPCHLEVLRGDGDTSVLLAHEVLIAPPVGMRNGSEVTRLRAIDPRTGTWKWSVEFPAVTLTSSAGKAESGCTRQPQAVVTSTRDGRYALAKLGGPVFDGSTVVIDLSSGAARPVEGTTVELLGDWLASPVGKPLSEGGRPQGVSLADPWTGVVVGGIADSGVGAAVGGIGQGAVNGDGTVLVHDDGGSSGEPSGLRAYSLPAGGMLWIDPEANVGDLHVDADGGTVIAENEGSGDIAYTAYSLSTGERRWTAPNGKLCGGDRGKAVFHANGHLATLDVTTGERTSVETASNPSPELVCPGFIPGARVAQGASKAELKKL